MDKCRALNGRVLWPVIQRHVRWTAMVTVSAIQGVCTTDTGLKKSLSVVANPSKTLSRTKYRSRMYAV